MTMMERDLLWPCCSPTAQQVQDAKAKASKDMNPSLQMYVDFCREAAKQGAKNARAKALDLKVPDDCVGSDSSDPDQDLGDWQADDDWSSIGEEEDIDAHVGDAPPPPASDDDGELLKRVRIRGKRVPAMVPCADTGSH